MSNFPVFSRLPAKAGLAVSVLLLGVLLVSCGGSNKTDNESASGNPTAVASPSPEVSPTASPPAFRTDCEVIRGTPFASPDEANWYRTNCARNDGPKVAASGSSQIPVGDTLIIPAAGVEAPVSRTTVPESGAMPDPAGYFNAVWYDFSKFERYGGYAYAGNLILSGHVDCAHCVNGGSGTAIFWNIRKLKVGDTAQYKLSDGTVINYVVVSSEALSVNSDWDKIVASDTADMTLITCTGTFSGGEYNQRHVVALKKV
ncbi:MAG: class F sortase [Dehalococcoidia bacterium]